mgnify:FL=1
MKNSQIAIIGGSGHVGMPLALKFASKGFKVVAIDINNVNNDLLNRGILPYNEIGAKKLLSKSLKKKKLFFTNNFSEISNSKYIFITVGTPITSKNKPNMKFVFNVINKMKNHLSNHQSIILRSTVYPGTTKKIVDKLKKLNLKCKVSYCPERVAQGKSLYEIENLPQIIASEDNKELKKIIVLFKKICKRIEILNFIEAEYSKLFSNAWRYIKFAVSNEFYMLSENKGFNFNKVYNSITKDYPRNKELPKQGFAAGPCLPKDAIQLWHSSKKFSKLAIQSYNINENLPIFLVNQLKKKMSIKNKYIGVLGTTFKSGIDDERDSLSIILIKLLKKSKAKVISYDPFSKKYNYNELRKIFKNCKIIFIGTPHPQFKKLNYKGKVLIDCWNFIN